MTRRIGKLGTERAPLDLDFEYFEDTAIRVHPQASDTVELDFLEAVKGLDLDLISDVRAADMDDDEATTLIRQMNRAMLDTNSLVRSSLQQLIHPDDWDTYWRLAKKHGQLVRDLMTDLKKITATVVEASTGFPTTPPSASADGPATTPPSSVAGSSDTAKALALYRGRPDLQEFFVLAEETGQVSN